MLRDGARVALQTDQLQVGPSYFHVLTFLFPDTVSLVFVKIYPARLFERWKAPFVRASRECRLSLRHEELHGD